MSQCKSCNMMLTHMSDQQRQDHFNSHNSRCSGHCCRRFPLPKSPQEIQQNYEEWLANKEGVTIIQDIWLIANMITPLHETKVSEESGLTYHYYTCRNLAPNGDCLNYKNRPAMCRDYPYGKDCDHKDKGCTLKIVE